MAQKPTTGSRSNSTSSFREMESDKWRSPKRPGPPTPARYELLESEMPQLDDNDCWFYQMMLERFIDYSTNPEAAGKLKFMVRVLAAQARRTNTASEDVR